MNELISIVVPVYNVENYLDRCIESLVNQSYRNLEIILVDDGSSDRSPEVCDEWVQKDSRICVIHKPNGGVSSARNAGMEAASGEWFFFMDSDDFLPEDALEILAERQQQHKADLVCGSFHIMKKKNKSYNKIYPDQVILRRDFADQLPFLMTKMLPSACGKLFSAKIIKEHGLSFPKNIPLGEDASFHYGYLAHVSSIVTTERCVYHYDMTREGSAMKKYYENQNQLADFLYGIQKDMLRTIEGTHTDVIRELEKGHFVNCLNHHVVFEANRKTLAIKIKEAAEQFPEAASHEVYGEAIRQQDWLKVARLWKKNNIKWYIKVVINRTFGLNL